MLLGKGCWGFCAASTIQDRHFFDSVLQHTSFICVFVAKMQGIRMPIARVARSRSRSRACPRSTRTIVAGQFEREYSGLEVKRPLKGKSHFLHIDDFSTVRAQQSLLERYAATQRLWLGLAQYLRTCRIHPDGSTLRRPMIGRGAARGTDQKKRNNCPPYSLANRTCWPLHHDI